MSNESQPKLTGKYVPCNLKCGQSEPCFGCDPSDYEWPSIPGKPETYSPRYHYLRDLLSKTMDGEHLTADEAGEVYGQVAELLRAVPEGGILSCLYRDLIAEAKAGKRCSVCLKVDDPSCIEDC